MPTIGSNLSQWGNVGEYETDRSTWGFSDTAFIAYSRSTLFSFVFSNSCVAYLHSLPGLYPFLDWVPQRFTAVAGKKYRAGALVTKTGSASAGSVVEIISTSANLVKDTATTKTFGELASTPTFIETYFDCLVSGTYTIWIRSTNVDSLQTLSIGTNIYTDSFSVFEWEEPAGPVCTLAFDLPNCVVVNETGPSSTDGSITLAVTGATGPVEYSKDNGATWQSSALFAGLDSGTYQCKARETGNLSCVVSQSFAVNIAAPTFSWTSAKTDETVAGSNDGTISITVSGTVAPFTYSKDGGTTYQGGNIFTGLAPGTYTITVKDFNDQLVSGNVTIAAGVVLFDKAFFSLDPIPFTVNEGANSAEDNYRLYVDVRVEDVAGSSVFTSRMKATLEPESNGVATFNLRQAFRDALTAAPPVLNTALPQRITDRIKFFKCYSGEIFDALTVPSELTASNLLLVLLGGLDKKQYPGFNFFTSFLSTYKKFLSWQPLVKYVNRAQEEYLTFFVYATNQTTLKMRVKCYYTDNTNSTYTAFTVSGGALKGYLYQFPTGPTHAGILGHQPAKTLTHYEVWLLNGADEVITEVRTYKMNSVESPNTRYFLYLNSVGGYDTLLATGKATVETAIEKTIIQKHLPVNYQAEDGEFEVNDSLFQKSGNYSTGYLIGTYGEEFQKALLDFMKSKRVFEITTGKRVPVIIEKANMRYSDDDSTEYYLRFNIQEAYNNHSFTPDVL